jgi:Fe2+ or Zn2+ uptake regulation protein
MGSTKLMLTLQRLLICTVIQEAFKHVRAYLVFTNAFPALTVAHTFAHDSLMAGAKAHRPAAEKIYRRFQNDDEYFNEAASMVRFRLKLWSSTNDF